MAAEAAFWVCVVGSAYSYVLYPLILLVWPKRRVHASSPGEVAAVVSMVIACRNEKRRIARKIENALAIDWPDLEILVASDASDDGSDEIVRLYSDRGVRLVRSSERRGKEHAQRLAVQVARGDIIVFSDAGTDVPSHSIRQIVARFEDPTVGAVSSEDRFIAEDGSVVGEGAYVRYEMWLRRLEGSVNSLVGLSGSFFAVRRSVANLWDDSVPSDFACAINAYRQGLISVSDPKVIGIYKNIQDPQKEFARKVRTALRGMAAVGSMPEVLNPFRFGFFSFQVFSHKLMRWLVPWFLCGVLVLSLWMAPAHRGFQVVALLQLVGYAGVGAAHAVPRLREFAPVRLAYFFVQVNAALMKAGVDYLRGIRVVTWSPSLRG